MTSIVRDQWYVAAYGREIGAGAVLPHHLRRVDPLLPHRGRRRSSRWPTAACTAASRSRRRQPARRRPVVCGYHGFTYGADGALRRRPRSDPDAAHRPGDAPTRSSSRTRFVWVWIGDPDTRRRRRASRGPRGWTARLDDRVAAWSRSPRGYEPAGGQPDGPVARDLPARRLHRHAGGRRHADHHRGRRRGRHRLRQPAHGRRRMPAVLRQVHRHRGPDHPLAGHRVPRRRACTCCTAASRRSACCRTPTAPTRTPSTSRSSTRSRRRDRAPRRTTSGWSPATSPLDDDGGVGLPRESNRTVVLQDVVALDVLEG